MIQQLKTCISDYGNLVHIDGDDFDKNLGYKVKVPANTYVYEEKSVEKGSNLTRLRTRTSERCDVYNRYLALTQCSGPSEQNPHGGSRGLRNDQVDKLPGASSSKPTLVFLT
ncbi:hypothetical protein L6452_08527 [Arctium lappa]|uniref:Uncharacterized protein n=1 Tax=Arctium lappa TaxID=4217 RepID=A0ACB9DI02_ARCLA|nr:hypothetical protein L6452_08527 [Arctium lappa]